MRAGLAAVLAIAVSASLDAQPPPPGYLVHIDVFATDARGRTVDDLKPADFELREDGAMQALQSVRFVDNTRAQDAASGRFGRPTTSGLRQRRQACGCSRCSSTNTTSAAAPILTVCATRSCDSSIAISPRAISSSS
jgi:hypothetical protein